MPSPALDHFFFVNSGSEAVENAIKLARHATGRSNLIVFKGGFHGRTLGCLSLTTSDAAYREGFGPFLVGRGVKWHVYIAPKAL